MSERINRRNFLKLSFAAALGMLIGERIRSIDKEIHLDWLIHPETYSYGFQFHEPPPIIGTIINSPFLYLQPPDIQSHISAQFPDFASSVAIFLSDAKPELGNLEPKLGVFDPHIVDQLKSFAERQYRSKRSLIITLFDGYSLKSTWNPVYGRGYPLSPYIDKGLSAFYSHPDLINAFVNRLNYLQRNLTDLPNLKALVLANELPVPHDRAEKVLQQQWVQIMSDEIIRLWPNTPLMIGFADPRHFIGQSDNISAHTAHIYDPVSILPHLQHIITRDDKPIVCQEIGVPTHLLNRPVSLNKDVLLAYLLTEVMYQTSQVNVKKNHVDFGVPAMGIWKIDAYSDNFSYLPHEYPVSTALLRQFTQCVRSAVLN